MKETKLDEMITLKQKNLYSIDEYKDEKDEYKVSDMNNSTEISNTRSDFNNLISEVQVTLSILSSL